jgi:hypothetical protein
LVETAAYNQFNVARLTQATKSTEVQIALPAGGPPSGSGKASMADPQATLQAVATYLSSQPGLAWLGQMQSDATQQGANALKPVQLASERWDYKQQGLTQEVAAIITVVVAYFTAGIASGAGEAAAGTVGTAGAGATTSTVIGGA